jgi:hypothetical protein
MALAENLERRLNNVFGVALEVLIPGSDSARFYCVPDAHRSTHHLKGTLERPTSKSGHSELPRGMQIGRFFAENLERETRFELATSTLARSHSTTELLPLSELEILPIQLGLSSHVFEWFFTRRDTAA